MIPQNIRSEHVLKAMAELGRSGAGIPRKRSSEKYDLEYNNKGYPPKFIISLANKYVNGHNLDPSEFSGGYETNNFLRSLGFNIISKKHDIDHEHHEKLVHDFAPRLKNYLENIYSIKVEKSGRAHLSFPSGTTIHVRGSIILKGHRGFYYLQEEDYKKIVAKVNRFFAVVFGSPERTFVFPNEVLKSFFDGHPLTLQNRKKPKWYFDIHEDDNKYYLKIHSDGRKDFNIDSYLNKWDQIEDFKQLHERSYAAEKPNHWLFIVTDRPKEHLTAQQILEIRMNDKLWGLNRGTPFRKVLGKDDKVIFSYGAKKFLSTATLASDSFELTQEEKNHYSHGQDIFRTEFGVKLKDVDVWKEQKPVERYLDVLSFVTKKERHGVYFQGGIKRVSEEEYYAITKSSSPRLSVWVVRAGKEGEQERSAWEDNVVTIGWNDLPSLSNFKTKQELERLYRTVYPDAKRKRVVVHVGEIWTFVHRIKKGDLVILPLKFQPSLEVAEVIGDYEFRQKDSGSLKHVRRVKWLGRILRSELDRDILKSVDSAMTVFEIEKNDAENQVRKTIERRMKQTTTTTQNQQDKAISMELEHHYDVKTRQIPNYHALKPKEVKKGATLFKQIDYTVSKLIDDIKIGEIGLPDIQRPFVWSSTKVRDLFDSMYNGFPVGYLLFWANEDAEGRRPIGSDNKQKLPDLLIIDGQQRLTSLFTVLTGQPVVDQDYNEKRIKISFRPGDGTFEVADASTANDSEYIYDISVLWSLQTSHIRFIRDFIELLRKHREVSIEEENYMSDAIANLYNLQNYPFTALELSALTDEQVADIFVRINSQGVKLNQGDFILTLMSVFWDQGRSELELFCRNAREPSKEKPSPFNHFIEPDPDQLLRASVALGFRRARLKNIYSILRGKDLQTELFSKELRDKQLEILKQSQEYVLDLTNWHEFMKVLVQAGFRSKSMISSKTAVVYSYSIFLIGERDFGLQHNDLRNIITRWFFMVSLTGRYSGSPETVMESDLAHLRNVHDAKGFIETLEQIIGDTLTEDFWNITLPNNLATISSNSPSLFAYDASLNLLDARSLFSEIKVSELLDPAVKPRRAAIERHHLFPRKYLQSIGFTETKDVNQIANYALIEWPENVDISGSSPVEYFRKYGFRVSSEMKYWHALPDGWERMSYDLFLNERRKLIAQIIRDGFQQLPGVYSISKSHSPTLPLERAEYLEDLIKQGESNNLEFKSSMRRPTKLSDAILSKERALEGTTGQEKSALEQAIIKEKKFLVQILEHEIFKTVAAFMNSEGGILLVGVEDDGTISGIEKDFETFNDKRNWDGWLQHFTNLINEHLSVDLMIYIKLKAIKFNEDKTVARIEIRKSSRPVHVKYQDAKGQNKMEFYIRATGTTHTLNPEEAVDYIRERWKGNWM